MFTARRRNGTISVGDIVTGSNTAFTATVANVSVVPVSTINTVTISANSDYGFIIDIIENL